MPPELDRVRALQPRRVLLSENEDWSQIAEGVLRAGRGCPTAGSVPENRNCGKPGHARGQRGHLDAELRAEIAGDELAAPVARVEAVAGRGTR